MDIAVEPVGGVAVAAVGVEELDASNVDELRRAMEPVLQAHANVVIDLSPVRFIDSSGLGAMLSFLRRAASRGGDLKLCGLSRQVRAAFELVRMHRIFEIFATRDEAVGAFAAALASAR